MNSSKAEMLQKAKVFARECEQLFHCAKQIESTLNASDTRQFSLTLRDVLSHFNEICNWMELRSDSNRESPELEEKKEARNTSDFLNRFEQVLFSFSEAHQVSTDAAWKPMLMHALNPHRATWVESQLSGSLNWASAKQAFLRQFPDTRQTRPATQTQERYVEYLLQLKMREFDKLEDYNRTFALYCEHASMDLTDPSLFQRYTRSLLPRYSSLLAMAPHHDTPHTLSDVMALLISTRDAAYSKAYASPPLSLLDLPDDSCPYPTFF